MADRLGRASLLVLVLVVVAGVWFWQWRGGPAGQGPGWSDESSLPASTTAAPSAAAPGEVASRPATSRDLSIDESRGGHTLARHVGRTDDELRERLRREPGISAASTYADRATAEAVVAETLLRDAERVRRWSQREGSRPNLALSYEGNRNRSIGRSLRRGRQQAVACTDAVVVLRWDGRGFYVLTSYPEERR